MDLLINLIIWLLKQLFGESEKPADVGGGMPRNDGAQRPRTVKSGGSAPSLEELLAEVRREAEEKRRQQSGGLPPAPAPVAQPRQKSRPQPVVRSEPVQQRKSIEDSELLPRSSLETRELKSSLEVTPEVNQTPERLAPLPISVRNDPVATVNVIQESRRARKAAERKSALQQSMPARVPAGAAVAAMLSTIRKGSGSERREIAQQAFVLNEIFGPCRSHRAYRPPPRV